MTPTTDTKPALIIGVYGYCQTGKTTMGKLLETHRGFHWKDLTENTGPKAELDSDLAEERVTRLQNLTADALTSSEPLVVTGLKHREEALWLREQGGVIIWIMRPSQYLHPGSFGAHQPEDTEIPIDEDHILLNDGSLEDLQNHIQHLLNELLGKNTLV